MIKPLTKSRFKLGIECPNKLFYTGKSEYANTKTEDPFLMALAEGGFQVEALARLLYEDGKFIDAENYEYDKAVELTQEELLNDETCLYEAAFSYEGLYVRTDIIQKKGDRVKLIEVKSKTCDPKDPYTFIGKKGGIVSGWKPYLFDLAFQKYVAQKAYPQLHFTAYLMLADKTKTATIDGLNQMFRITKNTDPRKEIEILATKEQVGESVLCEINVDDIINNILAGKEEIIEGYDFEDCVDFLKDNYFSGQFINWPASYSVCKKCEFKTSKEEEEQGLLSGFKNCFTQQFGWAEREFAEPNILKIWDFRDSKLFQNGKILMRDLTMEDLKVKPEAGKISRTERQWLQVEKSLNRDFDPYILKDELKAEMTSWKYPLHFIDFETSAVALPFVKGRRPYEQTAFQFSHHIVFEDGKIEHASEFICDEPGKFPNFEFARALKDALGKDNGTIFRYATHENTIVNAIIEQLRISSEADKEVLIHFLKSISHSKDKAAEYWKGERDMVDLLEVVKKYYYNPYTEGANSIKAVLPAILKTSDYLKHKYTQPIKNINLTSKNFDGEHIWLSENCKDPYKSLPRLFVEWTEEQLDEVFYDLENVDNGGAAMTAYAKMQFTDMSEKERKTLRKGLLKYCELDTLAMVMLYEHFKHGIS